MSTADYTEKIPNNVALHEDRRLQRALESWQPDFLNWWESMGPTLPTEDVYLRTAVNVGREGWAHFGHVPMKDYRWGIFLAERDQERRIGFGQHKGEPAWQKVPGEYRAELQRLIVIQGDTEPASVEQQRNLGATAPSLYDLRNLFQVNVEEGRHLWAMVYLLHAYFGREGREEAAELLHRNSGSEDAPRILGAFNEETPDWLSFFMFTYFTDRDGKYQLGTLKESAFDPLSRTCEFMLKEEAHHMFVGTTGIDRVVERTAQVMVENDTDEVAAHGAISLAQIQKYLNFHYSVSLDLFGGETSTNVANYYTAGLKGRWMEGRRKDDHKLTDDAFLVDALLTGHSSDGQSGQPVIGQTEVAALTGLNTDLRREYIDDCQGGVNRWNKILAAAGLPHRLKLPHIAFNRKVGAFAAIEASPDGDILSKDDWARQQGNWLPADTDKTYVRSLMRPVYERGKIAAWIAPPRGAPAGGGINGKPFDYDYVHLA
jgi:benzoyl-CoA 2,3-epoxidase subunit B